MKREIDNMKENFYSLIKSFRAIQLIQYQDDWLARQAATHQALREESSQVLYACSSPD